MLPVVVEVSSKSPSVRSAIIAYQALVPVESLASLNLLLSYESKNCFNFKSACRLSGILNTVKSCLLASMTGLLLITEVVSLRTAVDPFAFSGDADVEVEVSTVVT